jgi:hypothetical protein
MPRDEINPEFQEFDALRRTTGFTPRLSELSRRFVISLESHLHGFRITLWSVFSTVLRSILRTRARRIDPGAIEPRNWSYDRSGWEGPAARTEFGKYHKNIRRVNRREIL